MTLRKWFYLFWTTLAVGLLGTLVTCLILIAFVRDFNFMETQAGLNWNTVNLIILGGCIFSLFSQMGYFAYLIMRYIGLGIFRSVTLWNILQLALIIICLFDFMILRYTSVGMSFSSQPAALFALLFAASAAVAYWKMKLTNRSGFIPTLFFMFVVTILEATPSLRMGSIPTAVFMLVPLMLCNAWQIIVLPRILRSGNDRMIA